MFCLALTPAWCFGASAPACRHPSPPRGSQPRSSPYPRTGVLGPRCPRASAYPQPWGYAGPPPYPRTGVLGPRCPRCPRASAPPPPPVPSALRGRSSPTLPPDWCFGAPLPPCQRTPTPARTLSPEGPKQPHLTPGLVFWGPVTPPALAKRHPHPPTAPGCMGARVAVWPFRARLSALMVACRVARPCIAGRCWGVRL